MKEELIPCSLNQVQPNEKPRENNETKIWQIFIVCVIGDFFGIYSNLILKSVDKESYKYNKTIMIREKYEKLLSGDKNQVKI